MSVLPTAGQPGFSQTGCEANRDDLKGWGVMPSENFVEFLDFLELHQDQGCGDHYGMMSLGDGRGRVVRCQACGGEFTLTDIAGAELDRVGAAARPSTERPQ